MGRAARIKRDAKIARTRESTAAGVEPFARGLDALRSGNKAAAIVHLRQAIIAAPGFAKAHFHLAMALREQANLPEAIDHYRMTLEIETQDVDAFVNLAEALRRSGQPREAIDFCDRALSISSSHGEAYLIRGVCLNDVGDLDAAVANLELAKRLDPKVATTSKMLGTVLMGAKRYEEALAAVRMAAVLAPDDAESFRLIGDLCDATGRFSDGLTAYKKAIDLDPCDIRTYVGLSGLLCRTSLLDLALSVTEVAIKLAPAAAPLHYNRALAFEGLGRLDDALGSYNEATRCQSDCGVALIAACRLRSQICDWRDIAEAERHAETVTYKSGFPIAPFGILMLSSSLSDILECNRVWTDSIDPKTPPLAVYAPRYPHRHNRLRIGYLSADFHFHATSALIVEVFELHDRSRFETFGYSIGRSSDCAMRRRLVDALDHFVDLSTVSNREAAARIHDDEIDILIDLKGYTFQSRPDILARRPAPIQVNYLGYPSTMGASFIDYIIGDPIVTPMEHAPFYTEQIVHLPNAYQPNDRERAVATIPSRSEAGLPGDAFVFCCFNANYKIRPHIFDIWMRLLRDVPGSVLWLFEKNPAVTANLRREAAHRGVDPSRIVFAPPVPPALHLARMQLGDLFLDTSPYGAHTTASEALWVGLPVLTYLGETFSSRVGASLVTAVGLPELVVESYDAYESLAKRLAMDRHELNALRTKLAAQLGSAPLFDTPRYTRDLESALLTMAAYRNDGVIPRAIVV